MPEVIEVYTKNATYLEILCSSQGVLRELSDHFSYFADNYKFMPKFKNGMWDGKIRLFHYTFQTLYAGLFEELLDFAQVNNYELVDNRDVVYTKSLVGDDFDRFSAILDIHSDGKKIDFYDYQKSTVKVLTENARGTILSATSSGKSLSIYAAARHYQQTVEGKILIIVPTVLLVDQLFENFEDYTTTVEWNVEANVHKIYARTTKDADKQIYISTWQSLQRMPADYFHKFDLLIVDEVHTATANSLTKISENCVNAHYRFGFTGTLKEAKANELVIKGLFGAVHNVISTREMIDGGYSSDLKIRAIILDYDKKTSQKIRKEKSYVEEINWISSFGGRNVVIAHSVNNLPGTTLVLFQLVTKQGRPLYEAIKKVVGDTRNVYYIDGKISKERRTEIRQLVEKEPDAILVASYQTVGTGTNIKTIDNVFFASPSKSKIRVLQAIGRGLRLATGKTFMTLFDIVDDFSYGTWKNYALKHFLQRLDFYRNEKFSVKMTKIPINGQR